MGPPRRGAPPQHRGPPGGGGLLGRLLRLPMAALRSGTGLLFNALSFGASLAGALGARLLPAPVLNVLRGAPHLDLLTRGHISSVTFRYQGAAVTGLDACTLPQLQQGPTSAYL